MSCPDASNSAQLKSSRSRMLGLKAARCNVTPISSATEENRFLNTSRLIASTVMASGNVSDPKRYTADRDNMLIRLTSSNLATLGRLGYGFTSVGQDDL